MKQIKKGLSLMLAILLVGSSVFSALASEPGRQPSQKEEVIYANLKADGQQKDVYVVNIFEGGEIIDYGHYASVKMLNTTDQINQNGDEITVSTTANKAYYQGNMENVQLPWNIAIRYVLDGKEYPADEIAGKSGKLELKLDIKKNDSCTGDFFENYALQASLSLDSDRCANITAPDATIANVGSVKQLTYTVLPGKGLSTTITADATNFEMDGISINGIRLNLAVEVDDEELLEKVKELIDATVELDDGANTLRDGSGELKDGSADLKDGVTTLHSGVRSLDDGVKDLQEGLRTVEDGLGSLNSQSGKLVDGSGKVKTALLTIQSALQGVSVTSADLTQLTGASGQIRQAISDLSDGAAALKTNLGYAQYKAAMGQGGVDIDALTAGNAQAVATIDQQTSALGTLISQLESQTGTEAQVAALKDQVALLGQVKTLLTGNNAAIGGTQQYLDGLSAQLPALTDGLAALKVKYQTFDQSIITLASQLGGMAGNLSDLSDGIDALVKEYSTLDSGLKEYTGGVAKLVAGFDQLMDGVSALARGSKELLDGSDELYEGTASLYDGVVSLCDGTDELKDGTGKLKDETSGMDEKITGEIDDLLASIGGSNGDAVSFVSEKNTQVESVQFVIQTDSVKEKPVETAAPVEQQPLNFWQKLLKLFGWSNDEK